MAERNVAPMKRALEKVQFHFLQGYKYSKISPPPAGGEINNTCLGEKNKKRRKGKKLKEKGKKGKEKGKKGKEKGIKGGKCVNSSLKLTILENSRMG